MRMRLILFVRRLIAKGMPLYVGVVFILVGPIVNPIVYAATYVAFRTRPEMLFARMGLALLVGLVIGLFVYTFVRKNQMKNSSATLYAETPGNRGEHEHNRRGNKISQMLEHAGAEFFEMGKYLMFGAIITAAIQAFVPRGNLVDIGQGAITSHLFMMGFAFILSLCSTSDAFVASSFINTFSAGSLQVSPLWCLAPCWILKARSCCYRYSRPDSCCCWPCLLWLRLAQVLCF